MNERKFDGRANFIADDDIELKTNNHIGTHGISLQEVLRNPLIYVRIPVLKKILAHYELFRHVVDLPGDIVELGVYRGSTLFGFAKMLEIFNMPDRQKQVFGFDNFKGITSLDPIKDGAEEQRVGKVIKGYDSEVFEPILDDAIKIFDKDRFLPYKPRIVLIKGNIEETVPKFVEDHPGLRISLLHFDVDTYAPTKVGLEQLYPLVVQGGIVMFDEYGIRPWAGESNAVDEYFEGTTVLPIKRFPWSPNPGGYIIK